MQLLRSKEAQVCRFSSVGTPYLSVWSVMTFNRLDDARSWAYGDWELSMIACRASRCEFFPHWASVKGAGPRRGRGLHRHVPCSG